MKVTPNLGLEKPDTVDGYSVNILRNNMKKIDEMLKNLGADRVYDTSPVTNAFVVNSTDFTITDQNLYRVGAFNMFQVRFTNKKDISLPVSGKVTKLVADIKSEYAPMVAVPVASEGAGPVINGYLGINSPRLMLASIARNASSVPKGSSFSLAGMYLPEYQAGNTSVELPQPRGMFNYDDLNSNWDKIDEYASIMNTKWAVKQNSSSEWYKHPDNDSFKIKTVVMYYEGDVALFNIEVEATKEIYVNGTGDITNQALIMLNRPMRPKASVVPIVGSNSGAVTSGVVYSSGGVHISSTWGGTDNSNIKKGSLFTLRGQWLRR